MRAPALGIVLSDPRHHAIGAPVELAAVHGGLAPREAWLVHKVIRDTPKTRPAVSIVRFEHAPYTGSDLMSAADILIADDWLEDIPRFSASNAIGDAELLNG